MFMGGLFFFSIHFLWINELIVDGLIKKKWEKPAQKSELSRFFFFSELNFPMHV